MAGALDILYACVFWGVRRGVPARRICQSVAAGVLGKATFDGGLKTAVLGLALHFFIAVSMAVAYYLVARRWPLLWRQPWLCGAKDVLWITLTVIVHMVLVGIPCAVFARRAVMAASPASAAASS